MATYKSSYTGPQINQAVGNALNKDTSTLSNDVNHIPASSVVKSALNTVDESIAIRVSGNKTTYASGAAIGQYIIVDGSTITGITDGLYKAAKAIPYNTVIDSTYLTAASGGGLNDLKAAIPPIKAYTQYSNGSVSSVTLPAISDIGLLLVKSGASSGLYALNSVRCNNIAGDYTNITTDGNASGQTITFSKQAVHTLMLLYL